MQVFQQSDYYNHPAFSGFLPGIAGIHGTPLWVFYVNRGQAIISFGSESKDGSIAEFFSAAAAYRMVSEQGFRTFIKVIDDSSAGGNTLYEPFACQVDGGATSLQIDADEVNLTETSSELGIRVEVKYRTVPNARVGALIREVRLVNVGETPVSLEVLDGLSAVIPAGVDYGALKNNLTTAQAWMAARRTGLNSAVYQVAASLEDTANVEEVTRLNFATGYKQAGDALLPLAVVHDPDVLFPAQQALRTPNHFVTTPAAQLCEQPQIENGKLPCAFFADTLELAPGAHATYFELYGAAESAGLYQEFCAGITGPQVIQGYYDQGQQITAGITDVCDTRTANPHFDAYCRQNFLDNVLRGGFPHIEYTDSKDVYIPVYSRKHGDLERDYNWFVIPPEYYSQGWGNYRDVNQNRRCDILFVPQAGFENLWEFVSLIQTDGYNPLVVQGRSYRLVTPENLPASAGLPADIWQRMPLTAELLEGEFSPGQLYRTIEDEVPHGIDGAQVFRSVLGRSDAIVNAVHGEGFWIDHWTYNNDLLETCLAVFPEQRAELFWNQQVYPYYRNVHHVQPRTHKWQVLEDKIRQYDAVEEPEEAAETTDWVRTADGSVYLATLGEKLLGLAAIKFLTRDPFGIGMEMEAGKPGWYDALNGLPGLMGSSLPESWELLRLIRTLETAVVDVDELAVAAEIGHLYEAITGVLAMDCRSDRDLHRRWDTMAAIREEYRLQCRDGYSGKRTTLDREDLQALLRAMEQDVYAGLQRGRERNNGVYPTYLTSIPRDAAAVAAFTRSGKGAGELDFQLRPLPLFLEGLVRALAIENDPAERAAIHASVMGSPLYDRKLGMLRVNESLDKESHEIGRARAFTPGWLENGSIWMHMEYKYLLALLRAGLYREFWQLAKTALVPFMDPEVYGRSTLENSSFIVSSMHPDASLHGRGFVARLSGSTAEFISMWAIIFFGQEPFRLQDGQLQLHFDPCIPAELFDSRGEAACSFLHGTRVVYRNPSGCDVIPGGDFVPGSIQVKQRDTGTVHRCTGAIPSPYAAMVREGKIERIEVELIRKGKTNEGL
ncbi:hypothetical protein [Spirochaeta africana]|uniref:Cellobiose phosphorylase n=1 Tax=Spirochaeta africana (strain ATCC 700263 / DSM 8902 / Z-7692) TaxID=889378 RepID=H9UH08_SPIAZ|nr:hypothetical protein [Spirochaeta africana]AFG36801.1 hypothetical protein Spiaf_0701 [Spirochaeta africana DSM 8902]